MSTGALSWRLTDILPETSSSSSAYKPRQASQPAVLALGEDAVTITESAMTMAPVIASFTDEVIATGEAEVTGGKRRSTRLSSKAAVEGDSAKKQRKK